MKKKIAILGSTGSIGTTLLKIINKDKEKFDIILLTANKSSKKLLNQAKKFKVKNIIITDKKNFDNLRKNNDLNNINIYNNFSNLKKIFITKADYLMSSITGIAGLRPTLDVIKYTKKIIIANKESIICGWSLIKKELKKNKTKFFPVDSEHFSIWYGLQGLSSDNIEKIYITASGGPFYNLPFFRIKNASVSQALNHPNWKMGKKISIDSATLINKVYEVIEAKNIFGLPYKNIKILTHPSSYIHSIIKFNNGMIKIVAHDTTMYIPIFNTLYQNNEKKLISKKVNIKVLNNLDFKKVNIRKYPMVKLLNKLPSKHSLFETIIVSANDALVELYLQKKIRFNEIQKYLFDMVNMKEFLIYKKKIPKNINQIIELDNYVRLNIAKKVYKSDNV